jgi:hypothetical protein
VRLASSARNKGKREIEERKRSEVIRGREFEASESVREGTASEHWLNTVAMSNAGRTL